MRGLFKTPKRGVVKSVFEIWFLEVTEEGAAKLRLIGMTCSTNVVDPVAMDSFRRLLFTKGTPTRCKFDINSF